MLGSVLPSSSSSNRSQHVFEEDFNVLAEWTKQSSPAETIFQLRIHKIPDFSVQRMQPPMLFLSRSGGRDRDQGNFLLPAGTVFLSACGNKTSEYVYRIFL